jgi:RNA-directed DNA polymerase
VSTIVKWEERIAETKSYEIERMMFYRAWLQVRANGGAAGVDGQNIEDFERKLDDNLYTLWNRMSSGSYFPKPVRLCPIPKRDGGERILGIPTVTDRGSPDVGRLVYGTEVGPEIPSRFVRVSTGKIGA